MANKLLMRKTLCLAVLLTVADVVAPTGTIHKILKRSIDSNEGIGNVPINECLNDSIDGCRESLFSYRTERELSQDSTKSLKLNEEPKYDFDQISDKDYELFLSSNKSNWEARGQETTLRQVILIHRHGDRTPITFPANDSLANEPFWKFHGLGQLTNRGKSRLHMFGQILRLRYDKFLGSSVNKNSRKTRASGSLRCIESAQLVLSSFLNLDSPNSPDARLLVWDKKQDLLANIWQPASVNTLAAKFDGMLNEGAQCNALDDEYNTLDKSEMFEQVNQEFKHEAEVLKEVIGFEIDHFYKWFWASSVIEVERSYFANKMDPRILEIYDRVTLAGEKMLNLFQSTVKSRRLRAGLLINDMIDNMKKFRDLTEYGETSVDKTFVKKFVHYSAHDINLVFLLGMFGALDKFPWRPDYASNIMIELHQNAADEWFVKLFYMPYVPSVIYEVPLEACGKKGSCTLDQFEKLMQPYMIDNWQQWMKECNNDLYLVNPYSENS